MKKVTALLMLTIVLSMMTATFVWASDDHNPYIVVPVNPPSVVLK